MRLSEKIMDLRKKSGWSQEELAEKLGISRQSVSKWETGESMPDLDKIIRMSELWNVSTDYLLKESEPSESEPSRENEPSWEEVAGEASEEKHMRALIKSGRMRRVCARFHARRRRIFWRSPALARRVLQWVSCFAF